MSENGEGAAKFKFFMEDGTEKPTTIGFTGKGLA